MFIKGFRFVPTPEELISSFLYAFIIKQDNFLSSLSGLITVADVFSKEPWLLSLNDGSLPYLNKYEGYFFARRTMISKKKSNGKRPRRTFGAVTDEDAIVGGFWRSSTRLNPIKDSNYDTIIGHSRNLCFYRFKDKQRKRKEAVKTNWLMDEYTLASEEEKFQEWVLCRIRFHGKSTPTEYETLQEYYHAHSIEDQQPTGAMSHNIMNEYSQNEEYLNSISVAQNDINNHDKVINDEELNDDQEFLNYLDQEIPTYADDLNDNKQPTDVMLHNSDIKEDDQNEEHLNPSNVAQHVLNDNDKVMIDEEVYKGTLMDIVMAGGDKEQNQFLKEQIPSIAQVDLLNLTDFHIEFP